MPEEFEDPYEGLDLEETPTESQDECPYCQMRYDHLNTGLSFQEIYGMMWVDSDDTSKWVYKTRRCVLRYWRKLKQEFWEEHMDHCEGTAPDISHASARPKRGGKTQRDRVFYLLSDLQWHPWKELSEAGGSRYSARILELRRLGYQIDSKPLPGAGREYRMASQDPCKTLPKRVRVLLREEDLEAILESSGISEGIRATLSEALETFKSNKHSI